MIFVGLFFLFVAWALNGTDSMPVAVACFVIGALLLVRSVARPDRRG